MVARRRTPRVFLVLAVGVALLTLVGPKADAAVGSVPPSPLEPQASGRLSNGFTVTRWARPLVPDAILARPGGGAHRLARLRLRTELGLPNVILLLRDLRMGDRDWVEVRIAGRPNGRSGWVPRTALGSFHLVRTALLIDKRRLRATLWRRGRRIWSAPIGIGAPQTPTPSGDFWIRERLRVPCCTLYGPFAFGTSAYAAHLTDWPDGGVVGIHGTDEPGLIPGRPSHGCIRMRNRDIRWLSAPGRLPLGTPVRIR